MLQTKAKALQGNTRLSGDAQTQGIVQDIDI